MQEPTKAKSKSNKTFIFLLLLVVILTAVGFMIYKKLEPSITQMTSASSERELSKVINAYMLTQIAADRLHYSRDVAAAKQLLTAAAQRLHGLRDRRIIKIDEMLAQDLQNLNTLEDLDKTKIYVQLDILDKILDSRLPPVTPQVATAEAPSSEQKVNTTTGKKWQNTVQKIVGDLKKVVKIRKKSDANINVSSTEILIKEVQLKMLLEQLRWAIDTQNFAVYQRNVKLAQSLAAQVFSVEQNDEATNFIALMNELENFQFQSASFNIQSTVDAFQAIIVG